MLIKYNLPWEKFRRVKLGLPKIIKYLIACCNLVEQC